MKLLCLYRSTLLCLMMTLLFGCSLLEVSIDSQTTPLTQQELNMRLMTREYSQEFFTQVESAADLLSKQYPEKDVVNQSRLLLWKINAEEGLQSSAFQVSPFASLIDSWVFTLQMRDFFETGKGVGLFVDASAQTASTQLAASIDELANVLLNEDSYQASKTFVEQFSQSHPQKSIAFSRTPAYRGWLKANNIDESEVASTMGTMPEALSDVSDRLALLSEQTPKLLSWKAELIALNSNINSEDISGAINSFQLSSAAFRDFVNNNPQYMQDLARRMAVELQPLLDEIDAKTQNKLDQLTEERKAIDEMVMRERQQLIKLVERERKEIAVIVSNERALFAQDLDKISQDVLALAVEKLIALIKSTIVYFILFLLLVFFAPLGLGYILGKKSAIKKPT
ncbi:chemotaxis protein [Vibrio sp. ZSDZ34]|uniref:Chemotaxis protein n=1 Tax=Vibrio gelatinilyticus TaxID=2893468 RepID=A0A9X2AYY9_9VIBR|nr:chemotaxis protein [Vibrio gelatinilyticus]MCJ2377247.1 chemotaxis protein [Vibrio gelatinilyticus]